MEERLHYEFSDPELLDTALSHRSWCSENGNKPSNERLEFLGDAVLDMAVTDHIYCRYPAKAEGDLAKLRAALVNATTLATLSEELGLGQFVKLGKGEAASGGSEKPSILADALEAVLGAVHLDGGLDEASKVVLMLLGARVEEASDESEAHDAKTRLQELVARTRPGTLEYEITDHGPDHAKIFKATVKVNGEIAGAGAGRSKKQAEQQAARAAWNELTR
ncbi:MAG: ribonuclease III, partial [Acidimicrobiales bacterium]